MFKLYNILIFLCRTHLRTPVVTSRVGSRLDITMTSQHLTDKLSLITSHNKTCRTLYHTRYHTTMKFSTLLIQFLVIHHNTMTTTHILITQLHNLLSHLRHHSKPPPHHHHQLLLEDHLGNTHSATKTFVR